MSHTLHPSLRSHLGGRRLPFGLALLGALLAGPLSAQTADPVNDEDVVEYEPFTVTAEPIGYVATNTLAGGRLNTELKDTASAISVLTPEFMKDIGATNFLEAVIWAPNAVSQYEITGSNLYNDYQVAFRGLGSSFQARDYFIWYLNSDYYNIGRIDVSRGPNSVVFGDAGVGGMANVSSKRAGDTTYATATATYYSEGGERLSLEGNWRINDQLALLVAGVRDYHDYWQDNARADRDGYYLTATYRPFHKTRIDAMYEWGKITRAIAEPAAEYFSDWDGQTYAETANQFKPPSAANKVGLRLINSDTWTYNPARPDLGVYNMRGWVGSFGTGRQMLDRPMEAAPNHNPVIPHLGWHLGPPNREAVNEYYSFSVFANQNLWDKVYLEAAFNRQWQERVVNHLFFTANFRDYNKFLPNGEPNPYLGQIYGTAQPSLAQQANLVDEARFSAAYEDDLFSWLHFRWLAVAGQRRDRFEINNRKFAWSNNPAEADLTKSANVVVIRRYESDRALDFFIPEKDPVSGREGRYYLDGNTRRERKETTYGQTALALDWFDGRLSTLTGIRRDEFTRKTNDGQLTIDPKTKEVLGVGPLVVQEEETIDTTSAGGVVHLTPWLGLSANYAESYFPIGDRVEIDGSPLPAYRSRGHDLGLRLSLWDNHLYASLNYYENTETNRAQNGGEAASAINTIWGTLELEERKVNANFSDTFNVEGEGWELELVANPTESWQVLFNLSFPKTAQINGGQKTRAYYDAHRAEWQAALAALEDEFDKQVIEQAFDNLDGYLDRFSEGRRLDETFDYTGNLFANYKFLENRLRGLSVGGGVRLRGQHVEGNREDPYDYLYADSYEIYYLKLGYEGTFRKVTYQIQLNVDNVLDEEIIQPTEFMAVTNADGSKSWVPKFYNIIAPLAWRLSLTLNY